VDELPVCAAVMYVQG